MRACVCVCVRVLYLVKPSTHAGIYGYEGGAFNTSSWGGNILQGVSSDYVSDSGALFFIFCNENREAVHCMFFFVSLVLLPFFYY